MQANFILQKADHTLEINLRPHDQQILKIQIALINKTFVLTRQSEVQVQEHLVD